MTTAGAADPGSAQQRDHLLRLVQAPGVVERLPEPVQLASGGWSDVFIDAKLAVVDPEALAFVGSAMAAAARDAGAEFDAVGGLVLGAAPFTFAVAAATQARWFLIRKEPKGRGTNRWVEGARLDAGTKVMLVDDVVTRGGSIQEAYRLAREAGAVPTFATTLVDRGDVARAFFDAEGVPYRPLLTYRDLGIDPIEP